jgi:hypothetical protein
MKRNCALARRAGRPRPATVILKSWNKNQLSRVLITRHNFVGDLKAANYCLSYAPAAPNVGDKQGVRMSMPLSGHLNPSFSAFPMSNHSLVLQVWISYPTEREYPVGSIDKVYS